MLLALVVGLVFGGLTRAASAQEESLGDYHAWARFGIGSWKQVRVFKETLDETGQVESTATRVTKTTLVAVDETSYKLKVEVTVEVGGKLFTAEPQTIVTGFHGESQQQESTINPAGPGEVLICGEKYPIEIREIVINGDDSKRVSRVFFSREVAPFILRRETTATDAAGKVKNYDAVLEVVAVDMPYKVLTEVKPAAHVKSVQKKANGETTVTLEVTCPQIPGGIVAHTSKMVDASGQVIQRSTLELLEYEVVRRSASSGETQHRRLRSRRRPRTVPE